MMRTPYREPDVEDSTQAVILQNRCGNRLSMLVYEDHTELEFVYKPNAFRRKEFRARNFSNRDNSTTLFRSAAWPELGAPLVARWEYDPFLTRVHIAAPSGARNCITVLNLADENCFAISADRPLLLTFAPHGAFSLQNGLITEQFSDRGEEIVSFIAFESFAHNRMRMLDDGRVVLQLVADDVLLVGGEENAYQVDRVVRALGRRPLQELITRNESVLAPVLASGRVTTHDVHLQRVLDLNTRVIYSGIDEGGACFGALNRIYHLIWVRDGAMTTALAARAGNPAFLRLWAPFLLHNPSLVCRADGARMPEFLQMVGTHWTKSEDDGIFYAMLSLFTHYFTTGDDTLVRGDACKTVLAALDRFLQKTWDDARGMVISDTRGETSLLSSPYYGYDAVNGKLRVNTGPQSVEHTTLVRSASLYNQVNTYNTLRMACVLMAGHARVEHYAALAARIQQTLASTFLAPDGVLFADWVEYQDGTSAWLTFDDADYWEYAWAVSLGPFFPVLPAQLASARMVKERWPAIKPYGYCPWNTLSRMLHEYGMTSADYRAMIADELDEALLVTKKYPMAGALTEYWRHPDGWRALPFSAGSLWHAVAGMLLHGLPQGLAVRASELVDRIEDFHYRCMRITAEAHGQGDHVASWELNRRSVPGTLQVPEQWLRPGHNVVRVQRGVPPAQPRWYASDAILLNIALTGRTVRCEASSPTPCQIIMQHLATDVELRVTANSGTDLTIERAALPGTPFTLVTVPCQGDFTLEWSAVQ